LNPNYAERHHQYAWYLAMMGRPMEGLAEMKLAQQLDPVNLLINIDLCLPTCSPRQDDQCIGPVAQNLEMFPNARIAHMTLGNSLFYKGDYSASGSWKNYKRPKRWSRHRHLIGNLGYAYAKAGRKDEARKLLAELKEFIKPALRGAPTGSPYLRRLDEKTRHSPGLRRHIKSVRLFALY